MSNNFPILFGVPSKSIIIYGHKAVVYDYYLITLRLLPIKLTYNGKYGIKTWKSWSTTLEVKTGVSLPLKPRCKNPRYIIGKASGTYMVLYKSALKSKIKSALLTV